MSLTASLPPPSTADHPPGTVASSVTMLHQIGELRFILRETFECDMWHATLPSFHMDKKCTCLCLSAGTVHDESPGGGLVGKLRHCLATVVRAVMHGRHGDITRATGRTGNSLRRTLTPAGDWGDARPGEALFYLASEFSVIMLTPGGLATGWLKQLTADQKKHNKTYKTKY